MKDKKIICVEALHHGIPQVIKLTRVFTEKLHASLPIACTISDKRTVSLVKTYQEKTVRLVSSLNFIFSGFRPFLCVVLNIPLSHVQIALIYFLSQNGSFIATYQTSQCGSLNVQFLHCIYQPINALVENSKI